MPSGTTGATTKWRICWTDTRIQSHRRRLRVACATGGAQLAERVGTWPIVRCAKVAASWTPQTSIGGPLLTWTIRSVLGAWVQNHHHARRTCIPTPRGTRGWTRTVVGTCGPSCVSSDQSSWPDLLPQHVVTSWMTGSGADRMDFMDNSERANGRVCSPPRVNTT